MINTLGQSPLVTCIMPTFNRRAFLPQAILYFLRQDYISKELIIVDDGADAIGDLVPSVECIHYLRLNKKTTVGAKRNLACEQASGTIIVHWDDDDWHVSRRLRCQVETLFATGAEVCGLNELLFYDIETGCAWEYRYPADAKFWLSGSSLCYRRTYWAATRFANVDVGEDALFVWSGSPERMTVLPDRTIHVGIIHKQNASPKQTTDSHWRPYPVEEIRQLLGEDWHFYEPCHSAIGYHSELGGGCLQTPERGINMITIARAADLKLREFAAFNHGQVQPWMRQWELPFTLFQSHLANMMSVLDCTINPANFHDRLSRLYPHVVYHHHNPIQKGRFVLPIGIPDESFDRVICVNTLEHLLRSQRSALMADMAHKLKPGGLLVLTSDYYFDSFWKEPAFLQAGVMRADRQEIFNGWNKITPGEWLELCREYDLHPMAEMIEDPREDDASLYRNQQPYAHACIAGVFSKLPQANLPCGKRIVLALLSWNTRDVTMDSSRAYLTEARMLQRLGQNPLICVCDNGSSDGTADALQKLEPQIDVPHRFILNPRNFGNSIARNQIIKYALEVDADYLLFMDGDIEIVPFSSFAMLRYMENNGHRLGCIGADSSGQSPCRERATPYLYSIDGSQIETTNLVAWTQYGMFRRAVFDDGVRFDEADPFDQAGWGFEDNDLAFQMEIRGYLNRRFFGMTYLHRDARSSIRIMQRNGIDSAALYCRRRQYVIDKWSLVPQINSGPLNYVRTVNVPI
jgi:glycosyltransferase involved in cell wall biosynthesis